MESARSNNAQQEDSISIKTLVLNVQDWMKYLLRKWIVILISVAIFAALGLVYASFQKPKYIGELTFVIEDSKSNPLGAYSGLASQFGIDLGGSSSSGVFSGDNILEFLKSRLLIEKTLLTPLGPENKQSLADFYIDSYEMRKVWKSKPTLAKLNFPANANRENFSLQQDSILNILYSGIVKKHLKIAKPDKNLGFISVKCTTENELFSKLFSERLVREAIEFYVQTKTKRSAVNISKLQAKADSIEILLNKKTSAAAASQDLNLNPARNIAGVGTELIVRDKIVLQTMYAEVIKNLELSKMTMVQEIPIIQIVDSPILPLTKESFGRVKGIALGGFAGGFLIVLFLLLRRIYRQIMV